MKISLPVIVSAFALVALPSALSAADAKTNWTQSCAKCHGADGAGQTKVGKKLGIKDYTSADAQAKLTDDDMLKAITNGVKDDAGKDKMQAFKDKISDQEAKDLVAFIRTLKK